MIIFQRVGKMFKGMHLGNWYPLSIVRLEKPVNSIFNQFVHVVCVAFTSYCIFATHMYTLCFDISHSQDMVLGMVVFPDRFSYNYSISIYRSIKKN